MSDNKYEVYIKPYDFKTAQFVTKEIYDLISHLDKEIDELKAENEKLREFIKLIDIYEDPVINGIRELGELARQTLKELEGEK